MGSTAPPTGEGGAFVVTGEAGFGKSRLVREVAQVAGARGLPVLTGRAVAGGAAVPFRPLAAEAWWAVRPRIAGVLWVLPAAVRKLRVLPEHDEVA